MMSSPEVNVRGTETTPETPTASAVPVVNLTAMDDQSADTEGLDVSQIRKTSNVIDQLPFMDVDLSSVSNAQLKTLALGDAELTQGLYERLSLKELKEQACRWPQAGDGVERDLMSLDSLVESLRGQAAREGTDEDKTVITEGVLRGKSLTDCLKAQHGNRWRLQQLRDGEGLLSFSYFNKYVSFSDTSLPEWTQNVHDLQKDNLLDVARWVVNCAGESQTMVGKLVSFLETTQELQKTSEASSTEISQKTQDLVVAILGVQSATRVSIEDGKQFQRQINRSLENMSWQVAGAGKAQNQSLKDVTISSARMLQGINDHLNKAETMENVEGHLNDHMKKLIEIQQKNVTEGGRTTNVPVAPRMDSGVAPSAAAKAATLGTTGRAAKAMPVAPEAVPVGPPLPMPPAPPLLNQGLAPPQMLDPNMAGMAMPSTWACHQPPQFYGQGQGMPPGQDVTMSAQPRYKRIRLQDGTEGLELIE